MNAVLIQQIHPNTPGVAMLELTKERHQTYCNKWGIEYRPLIENATPEIPVEHGNWSRVKLLQDALNEVFDFVYWLDADTLIYNMDVDLINALNQNRIGVCWQRIPQLHHWNIGAMYISNTPDTRDFVSAWLDGYKDNDKQWLEQGVFNRLARERRVVTTISDRWNATIGVSMVPDAVVLGFHGQGETSQRLALMKKYLEQIAKRESAKATPAQGVR